MCAQLSAVEAINILTMPVSGYYTYYILRLEYTYLRSIYAIYVRCCIKWDKSTVKRESETKNPKAVLSRLNWDG